MNKLVEKLSKWNADVVASNGHIIMNNYAIVEFNEDFEHSYKPLNDFMLDKIRNIIEMDFDKTLECPSAKEIKSAISELCGRKRSERVVYCFGEGLPCVNARFLLDIVENLKVTEICYINNKQPLKLKGELGVAMLFPICLPINEKGYKKI